MLKTNVKKLFFIILSLIFIFSMTTNVFAATNSVSNTRF